MSVTVDGESQLLLICDYLENAGLIATVRALEAEANIQATSPGLAAVRHLALDGKWRELERAFLQQKECAEHELLKRARYSLAKQQYLETVAELDEMPASREPTTEELDEVQRSLERLEQLAPSRDEYSTLKALSDSPTDFFSGWDRQKCRKETCSDLLEWAKVDCFKESNEKCEMKKGCISCHLLTVLLAKGKIYEQCEQIIHERCGNAPSDELASSLDIRSWLLNCPDVIFQTSPKLIQVMAPPVPQTQPPYPSPSDRQRGTSRDTVKSPAVDATRNDPTLTSARIPHSNLPTQPSSDPSCEIPPPSEQYASLLPPSVAEHTPSIPGHTPSAPVNPPSIPGHTPSAPVNPPSIPPSAPAHPPSPSSSETQPSSEGKEVTMKSEVKAAAMSESTTQTALKCTAEPVVHTENGDSSQRPPTNTACSASPVQRSMEERIVEHREQVETATNRLRESLREATDGDDEKNVACTQNTNHTSPQPPPCVPEKDDLNPRPPSWFLQTTPVVHPLQKGDRNSSTPKPSTRYLISSPATSPVPHIPVIGSRGTTPHGDGGHTSERRQIDFDREVTSGCRSVEKEALLSVSWPTATLAGKVTDTQAVRSVAFSTSGNLVAVGANSKCLRILSTHLVLHDARGQELMALQEFPRYHRGSIYCLSWLGDSLIASGSNDKTIKLLSIHSSSSSTDHNITCSPQGRMTFHEGTVRDLIFLSSSGVLASGGAGDPSLVISDCETMKMTRALSGHVKQVLSVARGGRGSTVVSGGEDETVRLWDWSVGKCVHTLSLSDTVTSLSSHDHHLTLALTDGSCATYDLRNWKLVSSFQPHSNECRSVQHSPCGHWLLTGSYDGSVCLSEAAGVEWMEVAQHRDKVIQARWHPGGLVFASTSTDKTASFWTMQS